MATLAVVAPIVPGKFEAFKWAHADFTGRHWPQFRGCLQRMGLTRQVEWLQ